MPNGEFAELSQIPFSSRALDVLETAQTLTRARGSQYAGDTDLLGALARFYPSRGILNQLGVTDGRLRVIEEDIYGKGPAEVVRGEHLYWETTTLNGIRRGIGDALVNNQSEIGPINLLRGLALEALANQRMKDHQALRLLRIDPKEVIDDSKNLLVFTPTYAEPIRYANEIFPATPKVVPPWMPR